MKITDYSFEIKLNKDSAVALYKQIGDAIFSLIDNGALLPDTKLPPIRKFADSLGVNTVTIVNAYSYLESKGVVYSLQGSGTYVAKLNIVQSGSIALEISGHAAGREAAGDGNFIDFSKSSTSQELFPVKEFKLIFNEILDRDRGDAFSYEEGRGYGPLRDELSGYLEHFGIQANTDRLHIISGAQQGIDLISKALLYPKDVVLTENPTYMGATASFMSRGAQVYSARMESDGVNIEELTALIKQTKPKLFYCMPYFQTPTCVSYSLKKKRCLIELAYKYDFYIIEEDNQSDFNYRHADIIPLKSLDYKNKVIYIKSFSKILMPGLRIGFTVLPKAISEAVLAAKYVTDIDTSGFLQRAFHLFIKNGYFERHINDMKTLFKLRYDYMLKRLAPIKKQSELVEPKGGLNLWLRIAKGCTEREFYGKLFERGLIVSEGAIFSKETLPYFKISFADVEKNEIEKGCDILAGMYE